MEKLTGTHFTLHKAFSPGQFQATMTVAGDDDCSLDDESSALEKERAVQEITKENRSTDKSAFHSNFTDIQSTLTSYRLSNDNPQKVPLCKLCKLV